ncbi:EAL domain-containing protein [Bacillaceae bacterium IKA-2]|nr:EAL domain-containing protein [Bacillaceae bacterium IKA-2]
MVMYDKKKFPESNELIEDLLYAIDQASIIAITDTEGIIRYVNQKFCELSKYKRSELIGKTHTIINSGYHPKEFFSLMWDTISQGKVWEGELKNKAKDGSLYWLKATIVPILDSNEIPYMYIAIRTDITDRKFAEEKIIEMLQKDDLTGLPNRKCLENEITKAIEENVPFCLVYINFDNFKNINDIHSYSVGNEFIRFIGETLKKEIQNPDIVGRLSGDEFVVLFKDTPKEKLEANLRNIIESFGPKWEKNNYEFFISVSIGIVKYPENGNCQEILFRNADLAMQKAKKEGRGRWVYYVKKILKSNTGNILMAQMLQQAFHNEELTMHYQPKFNLKTGKVKGIEALIRWFHPLEGAISPAQFIPLAEETGQIYQIEKWVMTTVLNQKKWFEKNGFSELEISINLSNKTLMSELNFNELEELLASFNLDFSKITIEITETAILTDVNLAIYRLNKLKKLGLKIALDDFGTGYSSLTYLKELPLDFVKIDRSFVKNISKKGKDALIIKSILSLANDLDYHVIAEGIETEEQRCYLEEHNCESGQGFLFSKPLEIEDLTKKLANDFLL